MNIPTSVRESADLLILCRGRLLQLAKSGADADAPITRHERDLERQRLTRLVTSVRQNREALPGIDVLLAAVSSGVQTTATSVQVEEGAVASVILEALSTVIATPSA